MSKHTVRWQGYDSLTDLDTARALFEKRYGHAPVEVFRQGCGSVLAGPIGEKPPSLTGTKPRATTPATARQLLLDLAVGDEVYL